MNENQSWYMMLFMAVTLGVRHGFDLDHLATIDTISRIVREKRLLSKLTGILFSSGHGLIVTLISLIIGSGIVQTRIPNWLEGFGTWISITFLLLFGLLNLWNVFQKQTDPNMPVGFKSFLVKKLAGKNLNTFTILGIGALFAFSFDTFSQVALFSISASLLAGVLFSVALGLAFTFGMMLSDGLNGLLVSTLVQSSEQRSLIFSRLLGLAISLFSLGLGTITLFKTLP